MRDVRRKVCTTVLCAVSLLGTAVPASAVPATSVVVSGLNNPRQLSWSADGSLIVAEAGRGAVDPATAPCANLGRGITCWGMTGAVTRVQVRSPNPKPQRLITGLLSSADPDGSGGGGASGVSVDPCGRIYSVMTYVPPTYLPAPSAAAQNGRLLRSLPHIGAFGIADVSAVELSSNPDGEDINPNPYSVLALPDRQIVADAGGNTLLEVRNGKTRVLTVLPRHDGAQSVPTAVTLGPGGDYYVAEFGGIGMTPGAARVTRVARDGHIVSWQSGFDTGMFANLVIRVAPNGTRTTLEVPSPSGIVVARDGSVYVSAWSASDADGGPSPTGPPSPGGQIWRLHF